MTLDRHLVDQVADLASLTLSEEERVRLQGQLSVILEHIAKLQQLNTDQVPPMPHAITMTNVLRADEPGTSLPHDALSAFSPAMARRFFSAPRILDSTTSND